jgi:hypothetical protein
MVPERFPMKTHTTLKLTVAALALAFTPYTSGQTPTGATKQDTTGKDGNPSPPVVAGGWAKNPETTNISLAYEAFSLPIAKAGELQRKGLTDEELYKEVVATGKLERLLVVRTISNQRMVLQSQAEYKFPTEFTQPGTPCIIPERGNEPKMPLPISPTAFEKRDVGDSMEGEPTLSPDAKSVEFQFSVAHEAFAKRKKWGQGLAELEQPQFEVQKISSNITASVGAPRLIGTLNPPFGNGLSARTEQNVWFCFITATVVQNNAAPQKKTGH